MAVPAKEVIPITPYALEEMEKKTKDMAIAPAPSASTMIAVTMESLPPQPSHKRYNS